MTAPRLVLLPLTVSIAIAVEAILRRDAWLDEAYSLAAAHAPGTSVRGEHGNMAAYYLLASIWDGSGHGIAWLRLLSLLTMAAALGTFWGLARRHLGPRVGAWATLFAGTSYLVVRYAHEARSYALVALLVVASWLALDHIVADSAPRGWWGVYVLCGALLPFAHGLALLQVAAQVAAVALARPTRRTWVRAGTGWAAVAGSSALLLVAGITREGAWVPDTSWIDLRRVLAALTSPLPVAAVLLAALILGESGRRVLRARSTDDALGRFRLVAAPLWGVGTVALLVAVSVVRPSMVDRYVVASAFGVALLLASVAARLDRSARRPAASALVALILLLGLLGSARLTADEWSSAVAVVGRGAAAGDAIVFPTDDARLPFEVAWTSDPPAGPAPTVVGGPEPLGSLARYRTPRSVDFLVDAASRADRVWVVSQPYFHAPDTAPAFLAEAARRTPLRPQQTWRFREAVSVVLLTPAGR